MWAILLMATSDVVVIGNAAPEFGEAITRSRRDQIILDLVRTPTTLANVEAHYEGISW